MRTVQNVACNGWTRSNYKFLNKFAYSSNSTKSFNIINEIPQSTIDEFLNNGYCVIDEFLTESEVSELENVYNQFITGKIHVEGRDFCDMSRNDGFFTTIDDMRMINAMLPRIYYPSWKNNIYEQKTRALINRMYPSEYQMDIDYDQLLAKKPQQNEAIFQFHQDAAYWPDTKHLNDSTCTFSLALDATTVQNGCIAFLPQTHLESTLREHVAISDGRKESHTVGCRLSNDEFNHLQYAKVPRGGVSLHNHRIVHGSMGNNTDGYRRTYVIAYRTKQVIDYERSIGFTHSHNDEDKWSQNQLA